MLEIFKGGGRRIKILMNVDVGELVNGSKLVFVTGFPGFGLTGYIATRYIVEQLDLERVGVVLTKFMPDAVSIDPKYSFNYPYEFYSREKSGLLVMVNHTVPSNIEKVEFAEALVSWLVKNGFTETILIGGLDAELRKSPNDALRWSANSWSSRSLSEPKMEKGLYIVGPLALMLMFTELYKHPATVILPFAEKGRPDPKAAAVAVKKVAEILEMSIDVKELLEHAKTIENIENQIRTSMVAQERKISEYHM